MLCKAVNTVNSCIFDKSIMHRLIPGFCRHDERLGHAVSPRDVLLLLWLSRFLVMAVDWFAVIAVVEARAPLTHYSGVATSGPTPHVASSAVRMSSPAGSIHTMSTLNACSSEYECLFHSPPQMYQNCTVVYAKGHMRASVTLINY